MLIGADPDVRLSSISQDILFSITIFSLFPFSFPSLSSTTRAYHPLYFPRFLLLGSCLSSLIVLSSVLSVSPWDRHALATSCRPASVQSYHFEMNSFVHVQRLPSKFSPFVSLPKLQRADYGAATAARIEETTVELSRGLAFKPLWLFAGHPHHSGMVTALWLADGSLRNEYGPVVPKENAARGGRNVICRPTRDNLQ